MWTKIIEFIFTKIAVRNFEIGNSQIAIDLFEKLSGSEKKSNFVYLGLAYYMEGNYYKAYRNFKLCVDMGTAESKNAYDWIVHLDLENFEKVDLYELPQMNIHFMEKFAKREKYSFIQKNLKAYEYINSNINVKFKKKIDVFVYRSNNDNIGNRLSFANPPLLTIHTQFEHTKGHELAHLFVNNIYEGVNSKNRFIDEGFAEYFNEQQIYDETKIHNVLEGANVNIYCYWNNFEQYSPDFSYQVAGCFVGFFIYKMGIEKSQLLMRNQEYKAAQKVYRKQLDDIISQFESLTK